MIPSHPLLYFTNFSFLANAHVDHQPLLLRAQHPATVSPRRLPWDKNNSQSTNTYDEIDILVHLLIVRFRVSIEWSAFTYSLSLYQVHQYQLAHAEFFRHLKHETTQQQQAGIGETSNLTYVGVFNSNVELLGWRYSLTLSHKCGSGFL